MNPKQIEARRPERKVDVIVRELLKTAGLIGAIALVLVLPIFLLMGSRGLAAESLKRNDRCVQVESPPAGLRAHDQYLSVVQCQTGMLPLAEEGN